MRARSPLPKRPASVRVGSDGAISFTHPLFAWAVSASASTRRRRTAHAQAAELTADPEERARQLALAASGPLPELVAELEEVAAAARSRGAPASAADLLAHARRLLPPDDLDGWARNCAQEIPLLLEAGDWDQAWELGQEAIELLPPGPTRAAILLEVAEHRPGAAALCQQALDEANSDPVLSMRAESRSVSRGSTASTPPHLPTWIARSGAHANSASPRSWRAPCPSGVGSDSSSAGRSPRRL